VVRRSRPTSDETALTTNIPAGQIVRQDQYSKTNAIPFAQQSKQQREGYYKEWGMMLLIHRKAANLLIRSEFVWCKQQQQIPKVQSDKGDVVLETI